MADAIPVRVTYGQRARALRFEVQDRTGIRPPYPRSLVAFRRLRAALDRYVALMDASRNIIRMRAAQALEVPRMRGNEGFRAEFGRLGRIAVDPFDLDTPNSAGLLGGEPARLLARAKNQHRRDGASFVFSSWRKESPDPYGLDDVQVNDRIAVIGGVLVQDNTLDFVRASEIVARLAGGPYLIKIKFVREQEEGVYTIEDAFQPLRRQKRGDEIVEVRPTTRPGLLVGIDTLYYQAAYPMSAVIYGLYPIRAPNAANLAPMRAGDLNCVARVAIAHLETSKRGNLTDATREKIRDWEAGVHDTGARLQDLAGLEMAIRRGIVVRDIAGETLHDSGKYQAARHLPVEITLHNGHAWGPELRFPQARSVSIYSGDVWEAIRGAVEDGPMAVWLLGRGEGRRLTIDQFVLQDGRTYRTQSVHDTLKVACQTLAPEDPEALAQRVFGENHAASVVAREKNGWRPTPVGLLEEVQASCVEHGHGGLWNAERYHVSEVVCIDMKACYPASFQGRGEAAPWFSRFGHPGSQMVRLAINGPLPSDIGTGFARVRSFGFAEECHPVIPAWFGGHLAREQWAPTALLIYLVETGLLVHLEVTEALISLKPQQSVWLPDSRDQACSVIGKFTQGAKADGKHMTRRLITDQGELDYLVDDCRKSGTLVGAPELGPLGWVLTYYCGAQPQYTHLRSSMLAYAHINLLEMLRRFTPLEAVRVATDSIYITKGAMARLGGVPAFVAPSPCTCNERFCMDCLDESPILPDVGPAQWRDKGEMLRPPQQHACYAPGVDDWGMRHSFEDSSAPSHADPLARHALCYLNGGGGTGKTTRAIELYRVRDPTVFTPTHRLAKEMRSRGVRAQTYHSFFRWSGRQDWSPEVMGQKFVPRVVIWDEVCTVPRAILAVFLEWLVAKGVQVVCCGDQGQPPPITGEPPHKWLRHHADYYEEISTDYRSKDVELRALKQRMRLKSDVVQCAEMRASLPGCAGWTEFKSLWSPADLILVTRKAPRDRAQQLLFEHHSEAFPSEPVPLLYRPRDTRRQNGLVTIPGALLEDGHPVQEELVLNDVVEVSVATAREVVGGAWPDFCLGYAMTIHSSQGLTIESPRRVWIVDDRVAWSSLSYLAVSRVQYLQQLRRCCPPPVKDKAGSTYAEDPNAVRSIIARKIQGYRRSDASSGRSFTLTVDDVLDLREHQRDRCSECDDRIRWICQARDSKQFSVDRLDRAQGHTRDNIRLACLECTRTRGSVIASPPASIDDMGDLLEEDARRGPVCQFYPDEDSDDRCLYW